MDRDPLFGSIVQRTAIEDGLGDADGTSLAYADFDRDGCLDALVATAPQAFLGGEPTYVVTLRGNCDGSFEDPARYDAGLEPSQALPIDIDGDGWIDIAACNASDDTVSILRNRGDGTFEDHIPSPAGDEPRSMVVEDFNGDGLDDVAALNTLSNDVSILLNAGDGALAPEVRAPVGGMTQRGNQNRNFPYPGPFLGAGDLDGDGDIDLAIPAERRVKLLLNDGDGGFTLSDQELIAPDADVYQALVTDLTGDGAPDIASPIHNASDLVVRAVVFRNDGAGSFLPADVYDVMAETGTHFLTTVAAGDIDRDGDADLVFGANFTTDAHSILLNNGAGIFSERSIRPIFNGPWVVTLEDLDADGWPDLAYLTTRIRSTLRVHLNDGTGTFIGPSRQPPEHIDDPGSRHTIEAADLDADGDLDLVGGRNWNMFAESRMDVLVNDGSGEFARIEVLDDPQGVISVWRVLPLDFQGDSVPEIVVTDTVTPAGFEDPGRIWLIDNDGNLSFSPRVIHEFSESYPRVVDAGDLDADGDIDLVVSHIQVFRDDSDEMQFRRVRVLLNRGDETFERAQDLEVDTVKRTLPIGGVRLVDLDSDGDLDVVAESTIRRMPGTLVTFLNDGAGRFAEDARLEIAPQPASIRAGDVDGDGAPELIVLSNHNQSLLKPHPHIQVFDLIDGRPQLMHAITDLQIISEGELRLVDIDRDGNLDLIYGDVVGRVIVQRGRGDGTFETAEGYSSRGVFAVAIADFNGDTRLDTAASALGSEADWYDINLNRSLFSPCPADLTGSADPDDPRYAVPDLAVTADDFLVFLDLFTARSHRADISGSTDPDDPAYGVPDGSHDSADFFSYLDRFIEGCSE